MKYLLLIALFNIPPAFSAITNCGVYAAKGIIREKNDDFVLIINEDTQSQYTVSFTFEEIIKLTPYIDETVSVEFEINQRQNSFELQAKNIITIENRIPSPLMAKDTYLKSIKHKKCQAL